MATSLDKQTLSAQKTLSKRGDKSGSKPVQHAADLLEVHNEMVLEKNLTKRFERIGKQLKKVKEQSPSDWERSQKQIKALRPLLRLAVRSPEFRQSGISFLKVLKEDVFNEESDKPVKEKAKDKVKEKKSETKEKIKTKEGTKLEGEKTQEGKVAAIVHDLELELELATERVRETYGPVSGSTPFGTYHTPIPTPTMPAPEPQILVAASSITTAQKIEGEKAKDKSKEGKKLEGDKLKLKEKEKLHQLEKTGPHKRTISDKTWKKMSKQLDIIFTKWSAQSEYQQGVRELLNIPSLIISEGSKNAQVPATKKLQEETRDLIAQFSGRKVLDKLFYEIQELHDSSNKATRKWWSDFKKIILSTIDDYDGKEDLEPLRRHFDLSYEMFDTFRPRINRIIDLLTDVFEKMSNDKYVQGLRERLSIVASDLTWKQGEERVIDADAIGELSVALGDILRKQLATINLDDISGKDRRGTYHLSHLKIQNTIPEKLTFHLESEAVVDTGATATDKFQTEIVLSAFIQGIRTEIRDLHFEYSGMLSDSGVADVTIPSSDLAIDFVYKPTDKQHTLPGANVRTDTPLSFVNLRSHFNVSDLQINWHKDTMKHTVLVPLVTKLFHKQLVRSLEQGVQNAMNQNIEEGGTKMAKVLEKSPSIYSLGNFRFANEESRKKHHKEISREKSSKKHHDMTSDSPKIDRQKTLDTHV